MGRLGFEPFQNLCSGRSEDVVDAVYLVEFVLARKERFFGDEFEQNAAESPNIHLLIIVTVRHEALRGSVPARGYVIGIGGGGVFSLAGAEICQFD